MQMIVGTDNGKETGDGGTARADAPPRVRSGSDCLHASGR